ncbi:ComEC/Rec2 family competence protein [Paenibacillus sp. IB182496]|uniref:ComEC/Rec2 family competence protein n=1 Tax=Paenibacillus sabuli TaxID=2772509 RepID=A0A927BPS9_9BACL|nr:ComEC/Rec2 family competence protein [Paenibacillus sabuli]MBD2844483.1 ComEC/Rec2 family competence protein [Paenibacillus sabuli]
MIITSRPLLAFAACWLGGSAAAAALAPMGTLLAGGALAAVMLTLLLLGGARRRDCALCLTAFVLAAGQRIWSDVHNESALGEAWRAAAAQMPAAAYPVQLTGTIVSPVETDGDRASLHVRAETLAFSVGEDVIPQKERMLVQLKLTAPEEADEVADWRRGARIVISGELAPPSAATNIGAFDYRDYLRRQRVHWVLQAEGTDDIAISQGSGWTPAALLSYIDALRAAMAERLASLYAEPYAGFMKSLLVGLRDELDAEQYRQFSLLGLTHILAISGLHVGVVLYGLNLAMRPLPLARESKLNVLLGAIPCYVLLSGAAPSVIRAGLMAMLGLYAAKRHKLKDGLHVLAAAALAMVIVDPYMLENVSFQLSFLVTGGLIVGVSPLRKLLPRTKRFSAALDLLSVSVVAQLVSFPMTIYYFNQFNLLSLLANIVLVPLISMLVLPAGTLSLLLSMVWRAGAQGLADGVSALSGGMFTLIEEANRLMQMRTIWPSPPVWWIVLYYGLLLAGFRWAAARAHPDNGAAPARPDDTVPLGIDGGAQTAPLRPQAGAASASVARVPMRRRALVRGAGLGALLLGAMLIYAAAPDRFDRAAYVEVLDVGQGDAILVRTPTGGHILVDSGGTFDYLGEDEQWRRRRDPFEIGRKVVVPLLLQRGVQQLDLLVATHLDTDHIGGMQAVLEAIPVKRLLLAGTIKPSEDATALLETALRLGVPVYAGCAGQSWQMEPHVQLRVLWPAPASPGTNECTGSAEGGLPVAEEQNERSVVLWLQLYERKLLLTGDIGADTERKIIEQLQDAANEMPAEEQALTPIDLLKVAHHGSRFSTSDEWLAYWQPAVALISVGRTNTYGHPHPDVTGKLAAAGVVSLRTDLDGEVQLRIGPGRMQWRSALAQGKE